MSSILITGGNSGIGFATAQLFLAKGWKVGIVGRRADAVSDAVRSLGGGAVGFTCDVARVGELVRLAGEVEARLGGLDALFINAGLGEFRSLEDTDEAYYDHVMGVNLKGAFFSIQKLLPLLRNPGSIVLNTSVAGNLGMGNFSAYSASKAGLRCLARSLSRELLPRGIRVNAVAPGPIDTPIYGKLGMPGEAVDPTKAAIAAMVPMQRFGSSEEVARAVEFLATSASSYVAGIEISVDGGMTEL
ncbi:MAG: hypothetical protein RL095_4109 [Verrucomicrobiota bacterium]|jgi:NAD(P)-dependent dehydrogenase (short-subunit alcohol dehydrogenase family)